MKWNSTLPTYFFNDLAINDIDHAITPLIGCKMKNKDF